MQEHMKKKKYEIVKYMEEKGITIQEYKVFVPKPKKLHLELLLSYLPTYLPTYLPS